jgi:GNAT superfamily N-acetyltransferase
MPTITLPVSPIPTLRIIELTPDHAPLLQEFFDANPAYFLATSGAPAGPGEALEEITSELPAGLSFTRKWVMGYANEEGALVAMANIITDLLAASVFHVGTFIVATERHGTGDAQALYQGLEGWAASNGAAWMRLGVVEGNTRAERFWASQGYLAVRQHPNYQMGNRSVTVRTMVKPLSGGTLAAYLTLVPRDQPEGESELKLSVERTCLGTPGHASHVNREAGRQQPTQVRTLDRDARSRDGPNRRSN